MSSELTPGNEPAVAEGEDDSRPQELDQSGALPRSREDWSGLARWAASIDPFWYGLVALALALYAQRILMPGQDVALNPDFSAAKRWYVLAIGVMLFGWWGSYTDHSLLALGRDAAPARGYPNVAQRLRERTNQIRLGLTALAVIANLVALKILTGNWYSAVGGWLWAISMLVLVLAFLGEKPNVESVDEERPGEKVTWTIPRLAEAATLLAILVLALTMRAWRLGELQPGMHGDEGEAGSIGMAILNGVPTSPFMRGWFTHSNIYFWSVAICMKILGTGLIGLRSWAVLCGLVTVVFVYLIAREMFGVRAAIVAGFLIAFQSAAVLMSRQLSSNAATPALTTIAFYFFIRGLKTRKHVHFVIAGLAAGFNVYYFAGGRLVAPAILAFMIYLAILHRTFLRRYWTRLLAFAVATAAAVTPFLVYNWAHPLPSNAYPNDRFIWQNHDLLARLYGTSDWRAILWDQIQQTLSIFTWVPDASKNHILDYPIARPLEAALIVLGIVWALWRWKDSRFALLSIWLWSVVIVGGVLTTDAPNVPRIVGALPVLPILIAAWLDHFGGQMQTVIQKLADPIRREVPAVLSGAALGSIVLVSGYQNWDKYINHYLHTMTQPDVTEQAIYVHDTGVRYRYYDLGTPDILFTHGDNRFINPRADGIDMLNPSSMLPITDNGKDGEKDAVLLVWGTMYDYLPVLRAYYPEGVQRSHSFAVGQQPHYPPLVSFTLSHRAIDRHRVLHVRFVPRSGAAVEQRATSLGLQSSPPSGLTYPANAVWTGAVVVPSYSPRQFKLVAPHGSRLTIDGSTVAGSAITLAQGVHSVRFSTTLRSPSTVARVLWGVPGSAMSPIARRFLWDDHIGRSWIGEVRSAGTSATLNRRIDGFLGFRASHSAFGNDIPFNGSWVSTLHVTRPGTYRFWLSSNGTSTLTVNGKRRIQNSGDGIVHTRSATVRLTAGSYRLVVGNSWRYGYGALELRWKPPGGRREIVISPSLSTP